MSDKVRKSVYKALRKGDVALAFGDGKFGDSGAVSPSIRDRFVFDIVIDGSVKDTESPRLGALRDAGHELRFPEQLFQSEPLYLQESYVPIAFQGLVLVCGGKRHGEKIKGRFEHVAGLRQEVLKLSSE